jgi:hypothetical protein
MKEKTPPSHFQGKDALRHVAEAQTQGRLASSEIHGAETPGSLFAAFDAAKDVSVILIIAIILLEFFTFTRDEVAALLGALAGGLIAWKSGRATWLGMSHFERLHRVVQEEQTEIIENRQQEREELLALYGAKGFEGKLLEEVVDVLMADHDRCLREMLEEELGFRLEENEHPLVQGLGAFLGSAVAVFVTFLGYLYFDHEGLFVTGLLLVALASAIPARREKNRVARAIVWNLAIAIFAIATSYYLMQYLTS